MVLLEFCKPWCYIATCKKLNSKQSRMEVKDGSTNLKVGWLAGLGGENTGLGGFPRQHTSLVTFIAYRFSFYCLFFFLKQKWVMSKRGFAIVRLIWWKFRNLTKIYLQVTDLMCQYIIFGINGKMDKKLLMHVEYVVIKHKHALLYNTEGSILCALLIFQRF